VFHRSGIVKTTNKLVSCKLYVLNNLNYDEDKDQGVISLCGMQYFIKGYGYCSAYLIRHYAKKTYGQKMYTITFS
jgi:hypothetical protein